LSGDGIEMELMVREKWGMEDEDEKQDLNELESVVQELRIKRVRRCIAHIL
jgi:hypothetical protein